MVHAKKLEILLFLGFVVFPFGQLFKIGSVSVLDVLVTFFVLFSFLQKRRLKLNKYFLTTLFVFSFSLVFGGIFFGLNIVRGLLYFVRLSVYFLFAQSLRDFVSDKKKMKRQLINYLLVSLVAVGIFGWVQYFLYPDFRPFFAFGWDDHLYRLIGTFLDPGFTSIFLVFGFLMSLIFLKSYRNKLYVLPLMFFTLTLFFTYSRAGYVALLVSSMYLLIKSKTYSYILYLFSFLFVFLTVLGLSISLPSLISRSSEGTDLFRTYSIGQRLLNSKTGVRILSKSPLFGIGYNNICEYKLDYLSNTDSQNHACSGLDNSIVFILVTTGYFGFLSIVNLIFRINTNTSVDMYGEVFKSFGVALLVHSQFNNSIFYSFCLFVLVVVYSLSRKQDIKNYSE